MDSRTSSNSGKIRPLALELLALECLKKIVDMIVPLFFFIGSWSNFQVTRAGIKSRTIRLDYLLWSHSPLSVKNVSLARCEH